VVAVIHDPNIAFLYGTAFTGLKEGRSLPIEHGMTFWVASFLEKLYGLEMMKIPYGEKAFVLPTPRLTHRIPVARQSEVVEKRMTTGQQSGLEA
jgi:hypothetical protein